MDDLTDEQIDTLLAHCPDATNVRREWMNVDTYRGEYLIFNRGESTNYIRIRPLALSA